jgi:hypothetical protein
MGRNFVPGSYDHDAPIKHSQRFGPGLLWSHSDNAGIAECQITFSKHNIFYSR